MLKRIIASAVFLIFVCTGSSYAQSQRFEGSVFVGWSFNDGVSGQTIFPPDGGAYNRVDPKDDWLWGLSFGFLLTENTEAGFMWTRNSSKLLLGGTAGTPDRELGDMAVSNYHGYFSYNFNEITHHIRPFVYGGLGATNYSSVDYNTPFRSGTINGNTQFSTTWGVGVKYFVNPKIGIRVATSWTPTYIKSDAAGWWCDPFWGCYLLGDPQYSNQFHITGGMTLRF